MRIWGDPPSTPPRPKCPHSYQVRDRVLLIPGVAEPETDETCLKPAIFVRSLVAPYKEKCKYFSQVQPRTSRPRNRFANLAHL